MNDDDALSMMAKLFDPPAFYTPIHQDSKPGDFKQAFRERRDSPKAFLRH
jgi:hypothetical protein